jgi:hypothetical protein
MSTLFIPTAYPIGTDPVIGRITDPMMDTMTVGPTGIIAIATTIDRVTILIYRG